MIYTPKETLTEANCAYLKYVNPSFSNTVETLYSDSFRTRYSVQGLFNNTVKVLLEYGGGSQDRKTKHIELETSTFLDYSSTDKQLLIAVESLAYLMRDFCFRHCSILFDYERVKWRSTETEEYLLQITLSPTCSKFGL